MTWGAVAGGAIAAVGSVAGAKMSAPSSQMVQSMMDPRMYQMLYGQGAREARFYKGGGVKDPGSQGTGGLLQNAGELSQQPAMNPLQTEALTQQANYFGSPAALHGYNAMNQTGNQLGSFMNPYNTSGLPQVSAAQGQLVNGQAPQGQLANPNIGGPIDFLGIQRSVAETFKPNAAVAGSAGGSGLNYQQAGNKLLSGQVDNPWLQGMLQDNADLTTENFMRNVAPQLRGGAQMAGQFGGSRQGVMEGMAVGDLNRDILSASNSMMGNVYETAQNRMGQMAGQAMNADTQASIASANNATQTSIGNQQAALQAARLGLDTANQYGGYGLGYGGLGLDAAQLWQGGNMQNAGMGINWAQLMQQGGLQNAQMANQVGMGNQGAWLQGQGLNLQGAEMQNAARTSGAGMLQDASMIPAANLGALYGIGTTQQQAPWNQINQYANLLYPAAGYGGQSQTLAPQSGSNGMNAALGAGMMGLGAYGAYNAYGGRQLSQTAPQQSMQNAINLGNSMQIQPVNPYPSGGIDTRGW